MASEDDGGAAETGRSNAESAELDLTPPDPVLAVEPERAESQVDISPEAAERIDGLVDSFVRAATSVDVHEEAFQRQISEIGLIGDREVRTTSEMSNRLLDRPTEALGTVLEGRSPVGRSLLDLRRAVEELNPARYNLESGGVRKLLGIIPFGNRLRSYFERYAKANKHIEAIIGTLREGSAELVQDNAAIAQEQQALWTQMETLRQYAYMTERLDSVLEQRIESLSDGDHARILREDLLFPVRQRRQDILTQLAVAAQGYAALRVVEKNNREVVRAIQTATTTTVAALRTAVMVAQALTNQRLVLGQLKAVNTVTSEMIETTSSLLRDQTTDVEAQSVSAGIDMASLQRAWDNVFAALDQIDSYKLNALEAMQVTVKELKSQVDRSRSYLDRMHGASSERPTLSSADAMLRLD